MSQEKVNCPMFADDLVVLAESPNNIQNAIVALEMYCNPNMLEISVGKTNFLLFESAGGDGLKEFAHKIGTV